MKSLMVVLTAAALLTFVVWALFSKQPRKIYLLFMLYVLPLIDFKLTPAQFGSISLFDGLSYIILFLRYKDFLTIFKPNRFYFGAFCTLVFLLLLGCLTSHFVGNSLLALLTVVPVFIYGRLLVLELAENPGFMEEMIKGLKMACIFSMVFLAAQLAVGLQLRLYDELNQNTLDSNGIRYPSFFHDSQKFAQFLAMLSFLFLINKQNIQKPALKNLMMFLLVTVAMFLTGGRSAFLGLTAGVFMLLLFGGAHYKKYILIGAVASGLVIAFFSKSMIMFNREDKLNNSLDFRAAIWREAYGIYQTHPMLGIGVGNYQNYVMKYSQDQYLVLDNDEVIFLDQPENGYLKILTEYGGPGFVVVFAIILGSIVGAFRAWYKKQTDARIFIFIASIVCWLVSFISLYSLSDRRNLLVLICPVCFLIFLSNRSKIVNEEEPDAVYGQPV